YRADRGSAGLAGHRFAGQGGAATEARAYRADSRRSRALRGQCAAVSTAGPVKPAATHEGGGLWMNGLGPIGKILLSRKTHPESLAAMRGGEYNPRRRESQLSPGGRFHGPRLTHALQTDDFHFTKHFVGDGSLLK